MKKMTYIALACALALTGCVTTEGGSASGLSAVASALNTTGAVGSGGSKTENKVGAAVDVFKAVTVSDAELKSVALQYRAYGDRTEKLAPPRTNTPSASSA